MLEILIEFSMFAVLIVLGTSTMLYANEREKKGLSIRALKLWVFIPCLLFIVFAVTGSLLSKNTITNTPTISYIDIKKVYVLNEEEYVIKDKDGFIFSIKPSKICKGKSNQLIRYTQPNLSKALSMILGTDINEYTLVLIDPNSVQDLPNAMQIK